MTVRAQAGILAGAMALASTAAACAAQETVVSATPTLFTTSGSSYVPTPTAVRPLTCEVSWSYSSGDVAATAELSGGAGREIVTITAEQPPVSGGLTASSGSETGEITISGGEGVGTSNFGAPGPPSSVEATVYPGVGTRCTVAGE